MTVSAILAFKLSLMRINTGMTRSARRTETRVVDPVSRADLTLWNVTSGTSQVGVLAEKLESG